MGGFLSVRRLTAARRIGIILKFGLAAGESAAFKYRIVIGCRDELPDDALNREFQAFASA